jgi:hypothetical protein
MPEGTAQQQLGPVGSTVHRARVSAMGVVTTAGNGAVARVATAHRRLTCCGFGDSSYRNLSRFELKFELKFKKVSMSWNRRKNHWKNLGLWILMKFGQQAPGYTLLQGKINFHKKRIKNLNFTQKGKFGWFRDSLNPKLYF